MIQYGVAEMLGLKNFMRAGWGSAGRRVKQIKPMRKLILLD
jgi:hypothetical protein